MKVRSSTPTADGRRCTATTAVASTRTAVAFTRWTTATAAPSSIPSGAPAFRATAAPGSIPTAERRSKMYALIFLLYSLVHSDIGSCIDPDGQCVTRGVAGDSGGGMDPNGDHRCSIDPNGNCIGRFRPNGPRLRPPPV